METTTAAATESSFDFNSILSSLTTFFNSILAVIKTLIESITGLVKDAQDKNDNDEEEGTNA